MPPLKSPVFIDIETYSDLDVTKVGSVVYARHPSTRILCLGYIDGPESGVVRDPIKISEKLDKWIKNGRRIVAHNAEFEYRIINKTHPAPPELFYCTSLLSAYRGGPKSLFNCSDFWKVSKKIAIGKILIDRVIEHIKDGYLYENFPDLIQFEKYCLQDVAVCKELYEKIGAIRGHLPQREIDYWIDTMDINSRGIPIDTNFCKHLSHLDKVATDALKEEFRVNYRVNPASTQQVLNFVKRNYGDLLKSTDKRYIKENWENLSSKTKEFFKKKWGMGGGVVRKLDRILDIVKHTPEVGGVRRLRGQLWHFGTITGRYTSPNTNILNFPRGRGEYPLLDLNQYEAVETFKGKLGNEVMNNMRGTIKAPKGRRLVVADFSQIELRILLFYIRDFKTLKKLSEGYDIYNEFVERIFGQKENKESDRYAAVKAMVLSPGYGARVGKLHYQLNSMGFGSFPYKVSERLYKSYHARFPDVGLWARENERCLNNGEFFYTLANGRRLYFYDFGYSGPIKGQKIDSGKGFSHRDFKTGGYICISRVCSATLREIMAEKKRILLDKGYEVCCDIHDEVIIEVDQEESTEKIKGILEKPIDWLPGLPLSCKIKVLRRYRK